MAGPTRPPPRPQGLSGNALLALGAGVCALIIIIAVVSLRFLQKEPPPPPPPPPPTPEQSVGRILRYSEPYFKALIEEDAKRFHVPPLEPAALAEPFAFADELTAPRRMKSEHDRIETPHLVVATRVAKEWAATPSGQRFRYEHVVLSITNRTQRPLAYLVATSVNHPDDCRAQGAIAHNAIALAPGETLERTECLWHKDLAVTVRRIAVMEIPQLSYYYVSRLNPVQIMLDARTAAGHTIPPPAKECTFVPWRDIEASAAEAHTGWGDVIDFYARHNCDEYSYWRGYRRWTAPGTLPARAPGVDEPPPPAGRVDQPAASK